jgi:hypothetical protein
MSRTSPREILQFARQLAHTAADMDEHPENRSAAGSALAAMLVYGDVVELALRKRLRCVQNGTAA